ncbi:hypothetical protein QTP88_026056 [Uroleucon formosanum]
MGVSLIQYNLNCVHFCFIYIIFYDEMHFNSMKCKRVTAVVLVHGHTIIYVQHYNIVICKSLFSTPQPLGASNFFRIKIEVGSEENYLRKPLKIKKKNISII